MGKAKEFTVKDLKVGMVLHIVSIDTGESDFAMILPSKVDGKDGLCVSGPNSWYPLECVDEDFTYCTDVIIAVYDICSNNAEASLISREGRKRLWMREF